MKRFSLFEIIISIFIIGLLLYGAFSEANNFPGRWFDRDDAYYYFKVAQNISEGHGSTFDGVNITNGYHPLWMLICIPIFALARFDLILPLRVLFVVMGLLHLGTAILLYRLLKREIASGIAMLLAGYWLFDYKIHAMIYRQGLETGIAAFCIVLLLYVLSRYEENWRARSPTTKEIVIVAVLAMLVMFSRLDLVFLAVLIGFRVVFRETHLKSLLGADLLFIFTSVLASFLFRIGLPEYYLYSDTAMTMAVVSLIVRTPILYFMGMYEKVDAQRPLEIILKSFLSITLGSILLLPIMLVLSSALHFDVFPRAALLYDWLLMFLMVSTSRLATYWFRIRSENLPRQDVRAIRLQALFTNEPLLRLKSSLRVWLNQGLIYYGIVIGSLVMYMIYSHFAFGTASPVSGQIKRWWGSFASNAYGGAANNKLDFFGVNFESDFNAWPHVTPYVHALYEEVFSHIHWRTAWQNRYGVSWFIAAIVLAAFLALQPRHNARLISGFFLIPLTASAGLQLLSYNTGGYASMKEWYWVTQTIVFVLLCGLLLDSVLHHVTRFRPGHLLLNLIATTVLFAQAPAYYATLRYIMPYNYYKPGTPYMDVIPFLEENTEPGAIIGMTGGGNVGYLINDRTIVNMDGLINSHTYFKALQNETADQYLRDMGLDYIFANPSILDAVPYRGQFNDQYEIDINRFGGKTLIRYEDDD